MEYSRQLKPTNLIYDKDINIKIDSNHYACDALNVCTIVIKPPSNPVDPSFSIRFANSNNDLNVDRYMAW